MPASTVFWMQFLPIAVAGILALAADGAGRPKLAAWIAGAGALLGGVAGLYAGWGLDPALVHGAFFAGAAYSTIAGTIAVLAGLVLIGGADDIATHRAGGTMAALVSFGALAAGLAACAADLVALFLAIETAALSSYALVASARNRRADESAMKYYIQGAVSTGLLVLGVSILVALYAPDGSYSSLAKAAASLDVRSATPVLLGVLLLTASLGFKSAVAPFHSWAPDAYENAPASATAFMAGPLKIAFLFVAMLVATTMGPAGAGKGAPLGVLGGDLFPIVAVLGALSVVVGSLAALRQCSYTRMLGYAGVAQAGFAFIGVAALSPLAVGIFAMMYAIGSAGSFMAALAVKRSNPSWDGTVSGLAGIGRRAPLLGVCLTLFMASLAGLPPLAGFWGKFHIFAAALAATQSFASGGFTAIGALYAALTVIGLAGSVVALAYYGRVVSVVFAEEPDGAREGESGPGIGRTLMAVLVLLAVFILVLGFAPLLLDQLTAYAGFLLS